MGMSRAHTQSQLLSIVTKNLKLITAMPAEENDCSPTCMEKQLPPSHQCGPAKRPINALADAVHDRIQACFD